MKCEGSNYSPCHGEIRPVIVIWNNTPIDFYYCEEHVKEDCRRGFKVIDKNTNKVYQYIPEQLNLIEQ